MRGGVELRNPRARFHQCCFETTTSSRSDDRTFSQRCRDHAADVWDASHDHPFVRALTTFATSARYEWMFWEQVWTQQEWPV